MVSINVQIVFIWNDRVEKLLVFGYFATVNDMGSVVQVCVPDEKTRQMSMQKLQQSQPKEQRVGKTNVSIGSKKVGAVQIIKQDQFIAVSAMSSCDIKGKRESQTVSTQITNEMKREKQGEEYHESSQSILLSPFSSACPDMDIQMFSTGTKMVHHDDLVGNETVGNDTVGKVIVFGFPVPDCQELD